MFKKNKMQLILSSAIILLPMIAGLCMWNILPDIITTHWGLEGYADGFSSKALTVFFLPLTLLVTHLLCIGLTSLDKKGAGQNSKVLNMIIWIIPVTSLILSGMMYALALGIDISVDFFVRILLGLTFIIMGNYLPKCTQNRTIGVRVKWTLQNEENWNKTHRFAGKVWVAGGIFALASMCVPLENFTFVFFAGIMVFAISPVLYSYIYYRKQLKEGTFTEDAVACTPNEKRSTTIAIVIALISTALVLVIFFTGDIKITYGDTSVTFSCSYSDSSVVPYDQIEHVEYRETDHAGNRIFGYASFSILAGSFENGEFGKYTRYSYTACDSCVVLTVDGKTLVVNGKDVESTKEIYNKLLESIK